jgi:hypothetical protein
MAVFRFDVKGNVCCRLYEITVWGAPVPNDLADYCHLQPIAKPKADQLIAKYQVEGDRVVLKSE